MTSIKSNPAQLLIILFAVFIFGCAGPVIIKPNYDSPELSQKILFEHNSPEITKVADKRGADVNYAGSAQVGMLNTLVSYYLEEPVSLFVKKAVNKIISNDKAHNMNVHVNISIVEFQVHEKTFTFSEEGYFDCRLKFSYLLKKDSIYTINTQTHQVTGSMDVTNSLEELIYKGIYDCTEQFAEAFKNNLPEDSFEINNSIKPASDSIPSIARLPEFTVQGIKRHSDFSYNIGLGYFHGNKIKTGAHFLFQQYSGLSTKLDGGFGFALSYYDIENYDDMIKGSFFGLNARYSLRYLLLDSRSGPYLSGGLRLTFGNEKINYGSEPKTNYFFGPTLEEMAGISVAKRVFIEAGLYQIRLFGSDMLPADNGFLFGFYIGY